MGVIIIKHSCTYPPLVPFESPRPGAALLAPAHVHSSYHKAKDFESSASARSRAVAGDNILCTKTRGRKFHPVALGCESHWWCTVVNPAICGNAVIVPTFPRGVSICRNRRSTEWGGAIHGRCCLGRISSTSFQFTSCSNSTPSVVENVCNPGGTWRH